MYRFLFWLALTIITSKRTGNYCESKIYDESHTSIQSRLCSLFFVLFNATFFHWYDFIRASGKNYAQHKSSFKLGSTSFWRMHWRVFCSLFFLALHTFRYGIKHFYVIWLLFSWLCVRYLLWLKFMKIIFHIRKLALIFEARKKCGNKSNLWRIVNGNVKLFFVHVFGINTFHKHDECAHRKVGDVVCTLRFDLCIACATRLK